MSRSIKDMLMDIKINKVKGDFNCSYKKLTSLEGSPTIVERDFICFYNDLTSLEGAPEIVKGDFICSGNDKKFTEEEVRKYSKVAREIVT